jgi:hypothetical protein
MVLPYPIEEPLLKDLVSKNHFNLLSYRAYFSQISISGPLPGATSVDGNRRVVEFCLRVNYYFLIYCSHAYDGSKGASH